MTSKRDRVPAPRAAAKQTSPTPATPGAKNRSRTYRRVELDFVDPPPPSPLRGILPTTPEIEEMADRVLEGRPASPAARQRIIDDCKLRYHFGGHPLLYRRTDLGKEVVAVGSEEIRRFTRKKMSQAERETYVY
jgi:hypothetical protein